MSQATLHVLPQFSFTKVSNGGVLVESAIVRLSDFVNGYFLLLSKYGIPAWDVQTGLKSIIDNSENIFETL